MDINASIIKNERLARSWTQQHLADACNLSLRTVQRVERFGSAAPDTVMELCAVLEVSQDVLVVKPENTDKASGALTPVVALVAAAALFLGVTLGAAITYIVLQ